MFVSFCGCDKLHLTTCHVLNAGNITAVSYPPDIVSLVEIRDQSNNLSSANFSYIFFTESKSINETMISNRSKKFSQNLSRSEL